MADENKPSAPAADQAIVLSENEKNISDFVMNKISVMAKGGSIKFPKNYSPENAIRIAWLLMSEPKPGSKPIVEVCSKPSIANALFKMVILGLNPAKSQCAFIPYGAECVCQVEYQGKIAIARRKGIKSVSAAAVYTDDVFTYSIDPVTGFKTVIKHEQKLENLDKPVMAAYATKMYQDGSIVTEIMSMGQIRKAWEQGPMKGNSPAHKNFPDEMAKKSVISRLLKTDINSSDDEDLFDGDEDEELNPQIDQHEAKVKQAITEGANKTPMTMQIPANSTAPETAKVEPVSEKQAETVAEKQPDQEPARVPGSLTKPKATPRVQQTSLVEDDNPGY